MTDNPRDQLPDIRPEDNPVVWCERCQRHHRYWTVTRADFDAVVRQQAKALADRIDAEVFAEAMKVYGR